MSSSKTNETALENELFALQEEVALLKKTNADLRGRLEAYSLVSTGQTSLINNLIDKVPFGIMLVNMEGSISHANDAAKNILSITNSQLDKINSRDIFEPLEFSSEGISEKKIILLANGKYVMHSAFVSDEGSEKLLLRVLLIFPKLNMPNKN